MEYADLGLAFYYCLRDKEKRIFLIAVHHGMTQKGIIIGRSTLKDVYDAYGKEDDVTNNVYEYKGVQFYVESTDDTAQRSEADQETEMDPSRMRVVEIDVMAPDKSSNFCDGI
jgi:alanyl-tRNA synthetase